MITVKNGMRTRLLKQTAEETRQTTEEANVSLCKARSESKVPAPGERLKRHSGPCGPNAAPRGRRRTATSKVMTFRKGFT